MLGSDLSPDLCKGLTVAICREFGEPRSDKQILKCSERHWLRKEDTVFTKNSCDHYSLHYILILVLFYMYIGT